MNRTCAAIIPIYDNAAPSVTGDRAKIGCRDSPANTVTHFEKSGLIAGHLNSIRKMLPENAIAKAGSQTPERKVRYQNQ
jgi:hypothetical protein